jgi:hypothetical protein
LIILKRFFNINRRIGPALARTDFHSCGGVADGDLTKAVLQNVGGGGGGREGGESLDRIGRALAEGALDLGTLYAACLARKRDVVEAAAKALEIPGPLLVFVLEVPLKTALERMAEGVDSSRFEGWKDRKCSRHIKTRDARIGNASVPMEAEDLATLHLDLLAGREGFERGK